MRLSLASASLLLSGVSVTLLIALTLSEALLVGAAPGLERLITLVALVLPAAAGAVMGAASLQRREGHPWLAITGTVVNALFALFHLLIVLFAG